MNIDLNADVGEGADDLPLYALVSSVNIACGAHAGNEETMERSIELGLAHRIAIGAHPGYPDRESMGRRELDLSPADVRATIVDQIQGLSFIAKKQGAALGHVKPHGALYNQAAQEPWLAAAVADAVHTAEPMLRLVGLSASWLTAAGRAAKLTVGEEGFADRRYRADGTLAPRTEPDALITDPPSAAAQAVAIARAVPIDSVDGRSVTVHASTICLHADTPGAVENARAVRTALEKAGFTIVPL